MTTETIAYKNPLHQTSLSTPTDIWNDSCSVQELTYAIENGAVGATSNPTIVLDVLKKEFHLWQDRIIELIEENLSWSEAQITWKLFEEIAVHGSKLLLPVFEREQHLKGRLSIQTDPTQYRNTDALVKQAVHFGKLAPNMQVKLPVTKSGITAIEEVTYHGASINATVCFTVPQCIAVAEAVERGLKRRQTEGLPVAEMSPVCTLMVGRLDDWMQAIIKRDDLAVNPTAPHWAGIACIKKAYQLYQRRGYHTRMLAAAYRHHLHWSELIGGDLVLTIPYKWQRQFNQSDIEVKERILDPVDPEIIAELWNKIPDFRRAYDENGLAVEAFDQYGATARTLRSFCASLYDLIAVIRDRMIPNPDIKH